jgi:hypothetical protein
MTADELPPIVTIFDSWDQQWDWHLVQPADDPGDAIYELQLRGYKAGELPGPRTLAELVRDHGQVYVPISLEEQS